MNRNLPWPSCFLCETPDVVEYLVLKAWFDTLYKNQEPGETLRAEVCRQCVREHLEPWVRFSITKPELPCSPYETPLTFKELMKQAPGFKEVICDGCNQSCTNQHMQLSSGTTRLARRSWLTVDRQQQIHEHTWAAQLCPSCVQQRLEPHVTFLRGSLPVPQKTNRKTA